MEYFNDKLAMYSSYHTTSMHAAIDIINCFNKLANFDETFYTINQQFTILLATVYGRLTAKKAGTTG